MWEEKQGKGREGLRQAERSWRPGEQAARAQICS